MQLDEDREATDKTPGSPVSAMARDRVEIEVRPASVALRKGGLGVLDMETRATELHGDGWGLDVVGHVYKH